MFTPRRKTWREHGDETNHESWLYWTGWFKRFIWWTNFKINTIWITWTSVIQWHYKLKIDVACFLPSLLEHRQWMLSFSLEVSPPSTGQPDLPHLPPLLLVLVIFHLINCRTSCRTLWHVSITSHYVLPHKNSNLPPTKSFRGSVLS